MMKLIFKPDTDEFIDAANQYTEIWQSEGTKIVNAIEALTGLKFKNTTLDAMVFEGVSQSHPLKFRASYDSNTKKATIIHELLHVISTDYMLPLPVEGDELSLGLHKQINLVLYDLWKGMYGKEFADEQVLIESVRTPFYKEAWSWALQFTSQERRELFLQLKVTLKMQNTSSDT